ncbi:M48 family metallopeptidase [Leptospira sp. FAT2]|uniref:M48 family metallopeptidase n=1 Tax=Leptospira sanjuanensis TaxID=2879643 RepID=UPI001EE91D3C|nr:M48 family metallopeptidase [Leptospira sanjuanensis]MCG6194029.1 M48 family metallopeptidase [Leptospira sanjuanensis]
MPDLFYDGKTAAPVSGTLVPQETGLLFLSETLPEGRNTFHFSYTQIRSLEKLGNEYRLQLDDRQETQNDLIFTFDSPQKAQLIQAHRKRLFSNDFKGILSRFLLLPALPQILVAGILAVGIGTLIMTKLDRLYVIVPESADRSLGEMISKQFETNYSECKNAELSQSVKKIRNTIVSPKKRDRYSIRILKSEEVNAFALPGGTIYILSGLLEESESPEEVAAILAHEIAHVENRHGIRQMIRLLGISLVVKLSIGIGFDDIGTLETITEIVNTLTILRYSREFEEEADGEAFETLKKSGIGLGGFVNFFEREEAKLGKKSPQSGKKKAEEQKEWDAAKILDWFSTHPDNQSRIQKAKDFSKGMKAKQRGIRIDRWKTIRENCS